MDLYTKLTSIDLGLVTETHGITIHHVDIVEVAVCVVCAGAIVNGPTWASVLLYLRLFQVLSLLRAQAGNLHLDKAFLIHSFSFKEQLGVVQTDLVLYLRVLNTL